MRYHAWTGIGCKSLFFLIVYLSFPSMVRSQEVDSVMHLTGNGGGFFVPSSSTISPTKEMTVSVWLRPEKPNSKNFEERILSKKLPTSIVEFSNLENWEVYNATNESGQDDVKGFVGGVFDGRYIYCSPWWKGETQSGQILRYDTHQPYQDSGSWTVYNAENEDGATDIRGLEGAVFDGRYVYFAPLHRDGNYFGTVLRYDTHKDFTNESSWDIFNAEDIDSEGTLKGFVGAVFDGQFIYFVPNPFNPHSKVLRLNTKDNFTSAQAWSIYDLNKLDSIQYSEKGFFGAIYDGQYIYFVPFNSSGTVLRFDTSGDFFSSGSWSSINLNEVVENNYSNYYAGAVFDGRYIYYSPISGGRIVRFDTRGNFFDPGSWTQFEILNLDGEYDVQGGVGPTFDGRYVYFPPMYSVQGRSGKFISYDTYKEFSDVSSWNFIDMAEADQDLRGFEGSVFDGQYVYFFPMNFENSHGKIVRYNTFQNGNLSYALEYSRPSSSFGYTPNNLSFQVGTELGIRSIFGLGNLALADGQWHHVAATYDGISLKLYIDGELNNSHQFEQKADITLNDAELLIGDRTESINHGFQGYLNDIGIWDIALYEEQIRDVIELPGRVQSNNLKAFWSFNNGGKFNVVEDLTENQNSGILTKEVGFDLAVNPGEDETVCPTGISVKLSGFFPEGGVWSGNGVSADGTFTPVISMEGSHQILTYSVTKEYGNTSKTFAASKKLLIKSLPKITSSQEFICENSGVALTVAGEFSNYAWSTGSDSNNIFVTMPGDYQVTTTDSENCQLISDVKSVSFAPVPQIMQQDFLSLTSSVEGLTYEWLRDGVLLSDSTKTLVTSMEGNYQVRISDIDGCITKFSEPFYYPGIGESVTIFPNYSSGLFNIVISQPYPKVFINVLNCNGAKIYERSVSLQGPHVSIFEMDLAGQSDGLYIVRIKTSDSEFVKKIIVRH